MIAIQITAGIIAYFLCGWLSLVISHRLGLFSNWRDESEQQQFLAFAFWYIWFFVCIADYIFVVFARSAEKVGKGKK